MTTIFVDIGNSKTKIAFVEDEVYKFVSSTFNKEFSNNQFKFLLDCNQELEGVVIASVASKEMTDSVSDLFFKNTRVMPIILKTKSEEKGLINAYERYDSLGVDRWLGMLALSDDYENYIVISVGTAITIDVVKNKTHQGGVIVPGLNLMRKSLLDETALVRFESEEDMVQKKSLYNTTASAVLGGTLYMVAEFLNSFILNVKNENEMEFKVIASGGDFFKIQPLINHEVEVVFDLVIQGMIKSYFS